ncbi:MAG: hypothetical protein MUF71_15805 [Candidatus Kapabacteria bacterium]|jgi:tetratricopeptide (TPR) repeat protein|nr:hypothetical protein [Candidatus Kapabacteria bacterium]
MTFLIAIIFFFASLTQAQEPRSAELWYQEGVRLCRSTSTNLDEALKAFDTALILNPRLSADVYKWRSWVRQKKGDMHGALDDINQAITMNTRNGRLYAVRADLRRQMHDLAEAIYDYAIALQLAETDEDVKVYKILRDSCITEQDSLVASTKRSNKSR